MEKLVWANAAGTVISQRPQSRRIKRLQHRTRREDDIVFEGRQRVRESAVSGNIFLVGLGGIRWDNFCKWLYTKRRYFRQNSDSFGPARMFFPLGTWSFPFGRWPILLLLRRVLNIM